jgi:signal transduction histidine kinase
MLSRPLMRGDAVIGVIAAEMPTAVFTDYFDAVVAKSGVRVSLLSDDGTLMASEPHLEDQIGHRPIFADDLFAAAAKSRIGVISRSQTADGSPSIRAFGWVPARPLIISASRTRAEILARWYGECVTTAIGFVLFTVTAGCLTGLMVRALNRQQHATAELQTSEERLKQQSTLLQNTLENMGEGLSVFDNDGRLVAWNSRFVELLDLPDSLQAGTTTLYEVLRLQMARGDFGIEVSDAAVRQRVADFYRNLPTMRERVLPSGRVLQIRRRTMPSGVVSLYSDITERKQSEATMAHAWAQAELANRSKSEFLANMSHELRTPLNAIIGFSEILSGEHLGAMSNARYLEYSHDIHSSGLHLLSIINDVLDMSKIEAGKLEIHEDEVAVGPLLASVARMVSERARETRVELAVAPPDAGLTIWADERAMKQCLLNLLSNAVKFSDAGGHVSASAGLDPDGRAVFTIADDGIGMSPEDLERALQPFGQAKSATTRAYGGTGLGLPITKGLVEAHGGRLEIESRLGHGTRIRVVFPVERTRAVGFLPEPADAQIA